MTRVLSGLLLALSVVLLVGCAGEEKQFKVKLYDGEQVAVGDPVYVDGARAGEVKSLIGEPARVALIQVSGDQVLDRFRPGVYRDAQRGRINIQTHKAKLESAPLRDGALISDGGLIVDWNNSHTLLAVGVAVVAILVLVFAFKVFFRAFLIILTLALSVAIAWVTFPLGVPYVERVYTHLGNATTMASVNKATAANDHAGLMASKMRYFLVNRPDPRVVAFGVLAFCYFVVLTFLLGRALGAVGRRA